MNDFEQTILNTLIVSTIVVAFATMCYFLNEIKELQSELKEQKENCLCAEKAEK